MIGSGALRSRVTLAKWVVLSVPVMVPPARMVGTPPTSVSRVMSATKATVSSRSRISLPLRSVVALARKTPARALLMSLARRPATSSRLVSAATATWRKRRPLSTTVQALPVVSVPFRSMVISSSNAAVELFWSTTAVPTGTSATSEKATALLMVTLLPEVDATKVSLRSATTAVARPPATSETVMLRKSSMLLVRRCPIREKCVASLSKSSMALTVMVCGVNQVPVVKVSGPPGETWSCASVSIEMVTVPAGWRLRNTA